MQPVSTARNVNEVVAIHGWNITEYVMKGRFHINVKHVAVSFYLDVCDFDAASGSCNWSSKFTELSTLVMETIQRALQGFSVPPQAIFQFGGGSPRLLEPELAVSEAINCCIRLQKCVLIFSTNTVTVCPNMGIDYTVVFTIVVGKVYY